MKQFLNVETPLAVLELHRKAAASEMIVLVPSCYLHHRPISIHRPGSPERDSSAHSTMVEFDHVKPFSSNPLQEPLQNC